jgi:hypothetical protein
VCMAEWLIINGVKPWSVHILGLYRAQCELISKIMEERQVERGQRDLSNGYSDARTLSIGAHGDIKVFSVDMYQGGENDIILLSLSRTTSNRWVNDYRRINVALSRAKVALFVFGNFCSLENTCTRSSVWKSILSEANDYRLSSFETRGCRHHSEISHLRFAKKHGAKCDNKGLWSMEEFGGYHGGCSKMMLFQGKPATLMMCDDARHQRAHSHSSSTSLYRGYHDDSWTSESEDKGNFFCRCGHEHIIPCHPQGFSTLRCEKPCIRFHIACGHFCTRSCSSPCGDCVYPVQTYLKCGHVQNVPCHLLAEVNESINCCSDLRSNLSLASGLKWRNVGSSQPKKGRKLENLPLAKALERQTKFTHMQWAKFCIEDLRIDDFIEAQSSYFKPAVAKSSAFGLYEYSWAQKCSSCGVSFVGMCVDKRAVIRCLRHDTCMYLDIPFLAARFLHTVEFAQSSAFLQPVFSPADSFSMMEGLDRICLATNSSNLTPIDVFRRVTQHLENELDKSSRQADRKRIIPLPVEMMKLESGEIYLEILVPSKFLF